MKICIIGYGKMGKMVKKIAMSKGHLINQIIDLKALLMLRKLFY